MTGLIRITNRFGFTNLEELQMNVQLKENGVSCFSWVENLRLAPLQSIIYEFERLKDYPYKADKDYRVLVSFCLMKSELWAPSGFEVAFEDLELCKGNLSESNRAMASFPLIIEEDSAIIKVKGDLFEYIFEKRTGILESLVYNDIQYLKKGRLPIYGGLLWQMK